MKTPSHTPRLNGKAAKRFFQRLVARFDEARVVITDKLRSYIKPIKTLSPDADHRAHKGLNNAIEVSHRPTRKREKMFGRFKFHRQAERFLSARDQINLIPALAVTNLPLFIITTLATMHSACGTTTLQK